jgi:hypothetical protein
MTDEGQNNKKLPVAAITDKRTEKYTWTNTASYGLILTICIIFLSY